jgi:hypothetical protein
MEFKTIVIIIVIILILYAFKDTILGWVGLGFKNDPEKQAQIKQAGEEIDKVAGKIGDAAKMAAGEFKKFAESEQTRTVVNKIKDGVVGGFNALVSFGSGLPDKVCKLTTPHGHCKDCGKPIMRKCNCPCHDKLDADSLKSKIINGKELSPVQIINTKYIVDVDKDGDGVSDDYMSPESLLMRE